MDRQLFLKRYPKMEDFDDHVALICNDPVTGFPYPIIRVGESDIEECVDFFIMKSCEFAVPGAFKLFWDLNNNEAFNSYQTNMEIGDALKILDVAYPELVKISEAYDQIDRKSERSQLAEMGFKDRSIWYNMYELDGLDVFLRVVLGSVNDDYLKQYWISIYPKKNNKPSSNDRVVLTGLSLKELLDKLSSN